MHCTARKVTSHLQNKTFQQRCLPERDMSLPNKPKANEHPEVQAKVRDAGWGCQGKQLAAARIYHLDYKCWLLQEALMWPQWTQLSKLHNTGKRTLCANMKKTAEQMNPRIMCIQSLKASAPFLGSVPWDQKLKKGLASETVSSISPSYAWRWSNQKWILLPITGTTHVEVEECMYVHAYHARSPWKD